MKFDWFDANQPDSAGSTLCFVVGMNNKPVKVLIINGSYRDDGITDQVLEAAYSQLKGSGISAEHILLREYPIEFCLNCRKCTQTPGVAPGQCVLQDGMHELIDKIEASDAYILASPTNFGSVTALFKRFMERLVVYAYWPWGAKYPEFRKKNQSKKKALLISSSAAPAFLGRWLFGTVRQLETVAKTIGAKNVGTLFTGSIGNRSDTKVPEKIEARLQLMLSKLMTQ